MAANGHLATSSSAGELLSRLEEPQVTAALNNLLDHADLLAFLVTGLDGFLTRGDVIADSLASGISELRGAAGPLPEVDFRGLASSLSTLSGTVVGVTPGLNALLGSLGDPRTGEVFAELAAALVDARDGSTGDPGPRGPFALLRALKDPDVARGLGFALQVAKQLGKQLDTR